MIKTIYKKCREEMNVWLVVFSTMLAVMFMVSRHIFYLSDGTSTIDNVYVSDFHFPDIITLILTVPVIYIMLKAFSYFLKSLAAMFFGEKRKSEVWLPVVCFVVLMLLWLPYLFSYWPGGIYSDTVDSINMALNKAELNNHNPILYTLIWKFMFWVTGAFSGEGEYGGLKLFTVVQMVLLAMIMAGFIYWCYRKGIHKAFLLVSFLVMGLFPLYPFYGISLWKDTLFSLVVFVFSIFLYHVFADYKEDISWQQLMIYCVLSVLVIFLRNNGIYIAVFCSVVITAFCVKRRKAMARKLGIASLIVIITAGIIQGPVYDYMGYNIDTSAESLGVPLQQVAYIVATDGEVAEEDLKIINEIMPLENWKALYNPVVVDSIKFDPSFNREYFETNAKTFLKAYLHMVIQNPVKAVKAYLLETMGFWDVHESSPTAYICNFHFGNVEYFMSDYFDYYMGFSFRNIVEPQHYISAAIFVWMMLGTVFLCLDKRNYAGMIPILPTLGLWLSIMVAAPVAFSFRYVYALFLCVPLYAIICVQCFKKEVV